MRDSALKLSHRLCQKRGVIRRRRAHARQRFETLWGRCRAPTRPGVGEELMRDSALKHKRHSRMRERLVRSEKSSCATAL